jgi:cholesterol transport system auxiliary component
MVKTTTIRLLATGALAALLSACSILPKGPELTVYQLPQRQIQAQSVIVSDEILRVAIPYSRSYLNTHRIVTVTPEHSLAVMDGIRWEDSAPVVFRDSLIRALRSAEVYRAVINDDTASGDHSLRSDLQDFQLDLSEQPGQVVISLDVSLSNLRNKDALIKTRSFSARAPLQAESNDAVITAFADANQQIQQQIIQWLAAEVKTR